MQETEPGIWRQRTAKTSFYHLQESEDSISLPSISSTAMRLLWLVYHVVGKIQAYKLWRLIHSKVFVTPTAISPAAITTVSGILFFLLCVHSLCRLHCGQHRGRQASCHGCDTPPPSLPCPFSVLAPVTSVIIVLVTTAFLLTPIIFIPRPTSPNKGVWACRLRLSSLRKVFRKSNSHTVRLEESYLCSLVWSIGFCKKKKKKKTSIPAHAE